MFLKLFKQSIFIIISILSVSHIVYAGAFEDTADVSIDLTMLAPPSILLSDDIMTFSNLVAGDAINAVQNVTLTGATSRNFTCTIGGAELTNDYTLFSALVTLTVSFDTCVATTGGNIEVLSVTSTTLPSGVGPGSSDTTANIVIVISYDVATITSYS
jgi:hypothetical protein